MCCGRRLCKSAIASSPRAPADRTSALPQYAPVCAGAMKGRQPSIPAGRQADEGAAGSRPGVRWARAVARWTRSVARWASAVARWVRAEARWARAGAWWARAGGDARCHARCLARRVSAAPGELLRFASAPRAANGLTSLEYNNNDAHAAGRVTKAGGKKKTNTHSDAAPRASDATFECKWLPRLPPLGEPFDSTR